MIEVNYEEYNSRRDQFFHRLEALMAEYPDIMTKPTVGDHEFECECGYNPDTPKIISGMVVIVTTRNADDWEQLFWEKPSNQSYFHTIGMVREVLNSM